MRFKVKFLPFYIVSLIIIVFIFLLGVDFVRYLLIIRSRYSDFKQLKSNLYSKDPECIDVFFNMWSDPSFSYRLTSDEEDEEAFIRAILNVKEWKVLTEFKGFLVTKEEYYTCCKSSGRFDIYFTTPYLEIINIVVITDGEFYIPSLKTFFYSEELYKLYIDLINKHAENYLYTMLTDSKNSKGQARAFNFIQRYYDFEKQNAFIITDRIREGLEILLNNTSSSELKAKVSEFLDKLK